MRIWLGLGCALVPAIGIAVAAFGVQLFLPRDHLVSETAVVRAPAGRIAALVRRVEDEPRWRPATRAIRVYGRIGNATHYSQIGRDGRATAMELHEVEPDHWFELLVGDVGAPVRSRWTIVLNPVAAGTRVDVEERRTERHPLWQWATAWPPRRDQAVRGFLRDLTRATAAGVSPAAPPASAAAR